MSDFCCRAFAVPGPVDLAALYGAICGTVPPRYAAGQGFSVDAMHFLLEGRARAELRFAPGRCEIWLLGCPAGKAAAYSAVYGALFQELVTQLGGGKGTKEGASPAGK